MPLQGDICEGIRIVPMLLDAPTLRRNKFRDPRFMATRRVNFRNEAAQEPMFLEGRCLGGRKKVSRNPSSDSEDLVPPVQFMVARHNELSNDGSP